MKFLVVLWGAALIAACGTPAGGDGADPVVSTPAPAAPAHATTPPAPPKPSLNEGARVFFVSPEDGASVTSPVTISFGIEGAEVKPAGEDVPNSGHHHLIINGTGIEQGVVVPKDETHIHYGKGQTEAQVELEPGEYTLVMQFANHVHQSYGDAGAASIKITVTE